MKNLVVVVFALVFSLTGALAEHARYGGKVVFVEPAGKDSFALRRQLLSHIEILNKKPELLERFPVREVVKLIEAYSERMARGADLNDSTTVQEKVLELVKEVQAPQISAAEGVKLRDLQIKLKAKSHELDFRIAYLVAPGEGEAKLDKVGDALKMVAHNPEIRTRFTSTISGDPASALLASEIKQLEFEISQEEERLKDNRHFTAYNASLLSKSFDILYTLQNSGK